MGKLRRGYPSDVTDEAWWFVLPYLLLCREDAGQREHDVREVFNALRYVARGADVRGAWFLAIFRLGTRCTSSSALAGCGRVQDAGGDAQSIAREWAGRKGQPTAVCIDSRTLQSTPESGGRASYDGAKRRKVSKVHIAVDTLGHLLALKVTAASEGDREQVEALAEEVQQVTGDTVEVAYVDQGYTGRTPQRPHRNTASGLKSSSTPWPKEASCYYPDDGSSTEASPGQHASKDSRGTTNDSPQPSKEYTSSLSQSS